MASLQTMAELPIEIQSILTRERQRRGEGEWERFIKREIEVPLATSYGKPPDMRAQPAEFACHLENTLKFYDAAVAEEAAAASPNGLQTARLTASQIGEFRYSAAWIISINRCCQKI